MTNGSKQIQSIPTPAIFERGPSAPVLVAAQYVFAPSNVLTWGTGGLFPSQLVRVAVPFTVAAVVLRIWAGVPNYPATVEFWTGPNRTGAQIGASSEIIWNASDAWQWFQWSVHPTLNADCHLTLNSQGFMPAGVYYGTTPGGTLYQDQTFCAYDGAGAMIDADLAFVLWRTP